MQNLYSLTGEMSLCRVSKLANSFAVTTCANLFEMWTRALESVSVLLKRVTYFLGACPCSSMLNILYIYMYMCIYIICVCIYIYTYTHTHWFPWWLWVRKLQIPQMHRLKYGLPRVDIGLSGR